MSLEWTLFGLRVVAAVILYSFLGIAFYIIWRDVTAAAASYADRPQINNVAGHLRVVATPGDPLTVGQIVYLNHEILLGQGPDNTIVLHDASVSAQHARLHQIDGVWWLEDLGSRHGTRLNTAPISEPTPLAEGDLIEIGRSCFRVEGLAG